MKPNHACPQTNLGDASIRRLTNEQLDEGVVRVREAAEMLGIGRSTFYDWVKTGRIAPGIKLGPSVRAWPRAYLREFIVALSQKGAAND